MCHIVRYHGLFVLGSQLDLQFLHFGNFNLKGLDFSEQCQMLLQLQHLLVGTGSSFRSILVYNRLQGSLATRLGRQWQSMIRDITMLID